MGHEDTPRSRPTSQSLNFKAEFEFESEQRFLAVQKVEEQQLTAEMQQFHAEQKQLVAAAKSTDKAHRQAAHAAERVRITVTEKIT